MFNFNLNLGLSANKKEDESLLKEGFDEHLIECTYSA